MMPITGLKLRSADTPANKTRPKIDFHTIIDSLAVGLFQGLCIPPALLRQTVGQNFGFFAVMTKFSTVLILLKLASVCVNHAAIYWMRYCVTVFRLHFYLCENFNAVHARNIYYQRPMDAQPT